MPHSLADLLVHVVFSTKGRAPLLGSELEPWAEIVTAPDGAGFVIHLPLCSGVFHLRTEPRTEVRSRRS